MNPVDRTSRLSRRAFLFLTSAGIGLLGAVPAVSARGSAEKYVASIGADVIRLANSGAAKPAMRKRFSALINRHTNLRSVGLFALGPYQRQLPASQREEFSRLVGGYIAAFFVYYLKDFKGTSVDIKSSVQQGASTVVNSAIRFKSGSTSAVSWRITSGRVSDIKVRGIWLSLQLRKRFTSILKRGDGDFGPLFRELKSADTW